jgi:hypothetical protein
VPPLVQPAAVERIDRGLDALHLAAATARPGGDGDARVIPLHGTASPVAG